MRTTKTGSMKRTIDGRGQLRRELRSTRAEELGDEKGTFPISDKPSMIRVRRSAERGHAKYDWLDTWHTFPSIPATIQPTWVSVACGSSMKTEWSPVKASGCM